MSSPRARTGYKIATAGIALILSLAGAEWYSRAFMEPARLEQVTGQSPWNEAWEAWRTTAPFCAYMPTPGFRFPGGKKTVNLHGFISTPALDYELPPGTVRIAFLGGSSTSGQGHELADEQTWPWRTAALLRDRLGVPIEALDAAAAGYTTFESYGRLWSQVRLFHPQITVVYHGWNDLYFADDADRVRTWRQGWARDEEVRIKLYEPWAIDPWISWSQGLSTLRLRLATPGAHEAGADRPMRTGWDRRALDHFRTNLELIVAAGPILDTEVLVAKQATLFVPGLPEDQQARCDYARHGFGHEEHLEAFAGMYGVIDEVVPAGSVIDARSLSGRPELFADHIHPTAEGAEALAELMATALAPHVIRLAGPPRSEAPLGAGAP